MRRKLLSIALVSTVLFWGPSIGSSGVTDAVPSGIQGHSASFGWHTDDAAESLLLSKMNTAVFVLAADDSKLMMDASR